jgi:hypothetical protein
MIRNFFNIRVLTCSFERQIYGLKLKFEIMLHFIYITPEEQYERPYKKKHLSDKRYVLDLTSV